MTKFSTCTFFLKKKKPFSFSEVSFETPREGEGPPSAVSAPLRRRGDTNPSGGLCAYRGPLFLLGVAVVVLVCLLVGALVVSTDRHVQDLNARVELLEGARSSSSLSGFRSCSKCLIGSFG